MAGKILHKNPRLQAKVCPHVPLGTSDHKQLSVQCLLLPIGGETNGRSLSSDSCTLPDVWSKTSLSCVLKYHCYCCRKYKQNSTKCQNPVKKNFWVLPCAIHFLKKKLDRKPDLINTPSLNFLFLKAALYATQKQFLSNCSKQCPLNIFAPQLFCFGSCFSP